MSLSQIILNEETEDNKELCSPIDLITELVTVMTSLKGEFVTETGVDYARMRESETFDAYKRLATRLRALPNLSSSMSMTQRKAFFINIYNCLTLHALAFQSKLPESPLKQEGLWTKYAYKIGEHVLSQDDIEHGILRANRKHPSGKIAFGPDDSRRSLMLDKCDARIHFALNCGARSCPPIWIYKADNLDSQLTLAAKSFCTDGVVVTESKTLGLSKLFEWYGSDFTMDGAVAIWQALLPFVKQNVVEFIKQNDKGAPNDIKIEFLAYDWSLNQA